MLPLMRMTWTLNRRMLAWLTPLFALYLSMVIGSLMEGNVAGFLAGGSGTAGLLLAVVVFQGLAGATEGFVLALPVSRAQVVRAKYASCLAALALGCALPLAAAAAAHAVAPLRVPALGAETLGILGLIALGYATVVFVLLPFVYRFGPARGLPAFAGCLTALSVAALATRGLDGTMEVLVSVGMRALARPGFALALAAGVALLGASSLGISAWAYRRRVL